MRRHISQRPHGRNTLHTVDCTTTVPRTSSSCSSRGIDIVAGNAPLTLLPDRSTTTRAAETHNERSVMPPTSVRGVCARVCVCVWGGG